MILIPRVDGVDTKPIKTSYSAVAGTAYVTFDKVRVPIGNTLGEEGAGLSVILSNFNHERWMVTATSQSAQRLIVEECLKCVYFVWQSLTNGIDLHIKRWTNQRMVFGKPLNAQAVIRAKLANMISRVESGQNWLESITYQMNNVRSASPILSDMNNSHELS
jgi:alkylation response protein AidB-like acyl-CoA dehydrogenase